jgi:DNA-binding MarR family transcriptional regulator
VTQSRDRQNRSLFDAHRAALSELPPSAKLVAKTLEQSEPLSQGQLAEETLLPDRTVRYALTRLDDAEVLATHHDLSDARRQLYSLAPPG